VTSEGLSIGDVAQRSGVERSAPRFYEAQGLIRSARTEGNQRRYEREVLRRIAFIRIAQRVGLTLGEIREALAALPDHRTPTPADWGRLSRAWRARLDEQITLLERLRDELSDCIGCGCLSLSTCHLHNPDDAAATLGSGPRYLIGNSASEVIGD
jgi:MerR family redox-sensitive transcriptional activator SoxR